MDVKEQALLAREASYRLLSCAREIKDRALSRMAAKISENKKLILSRNLEDCEEARTAQIAAPLLKRLELDDRKIEQMIKGIEDVVRREVERFGGPGDQELAIAHASEVIGMAEVPVEAVRQKRDSSICRLTKMVAECELDAAISAGNTGAFAAASLAFLSSTISLT